MTPIYAESPKLLKRQLLGDGLFLCWCYLCAQLGRIVHNAITALAAPGEKLSLAASSLADQAVRLERAVPSFLNISTDRLEDSALSLKATADGQVQAVHDIAQAVGWAIALIPIAAVAAFYVTSRVKWWLTYDAVSALRDGGDFEKLLALRALAHAPYRDLRRISADPVGDFDAGNYKKLAGLQAESLGLVDAGIRPKSQVSSPPS